MITDTKKTAKKIEVNNFLNETFETIYSRRSIRKYKDKPVDRKIIEQIIGAGRMAPSAMNKQPWNFYVLTDKEVIKSFSKQIEKASLKGILKMGTKEIVKSAVSALLHPHNLSFFKGGDFIFHGASVVIFLTAPKDEEWAGLDVGACAQNMMLAAKSLGLDTCPVGLAKFVEGTEIYSKLHLPKNEQVLLAIILGYGNEIPEVHERKKNNLFFID